MNQVKFLIISKQNRCGECMELLKKGLTGYQIKIIALICMTIDHIGAFAFEIPIVSEYYSQFRIIGRIAAPLFLYIITESIRHTKNRACYILRLYIAAVLVGLFTTITNHLLGGVFGIFIPGNILFTFFYTALYINMLEGIWSSIQNKVYQKLFVYVLGIAATILAHIASISIPTESQFYYDLLNSFLVSPLHVDYTILFIMLGILIYFVKQKPLQIAVFVLFCILSVNYHFADYETVIALGASSFFGYPQYWMVLALPFILLYNGLRGKSRKYFFYIS